MYTTIKVPGFKFNALLDKTGDVVGITPYDDAPATTRPRKATRSETIKVKTFLKQVASSHTIDPAYPLYNINKISIKPNISKSKRGTK